MSQCPMGLAGPAAALLHLPLLRAAPSLRVRGVQGRAAVKPCWFLILTGRGKQSG